jgi:acetylornithine deacetylase
VILKDPVDAALAAIDEEALVADLQALVQVPSITGDEAAAQARMGDLIVAAGLESESWEIDLGALRRTEGFPGSEAERSRAVGLLGRLGEGPRRFVLNGHIDVVDPGHETWRNGGPWSGRLVDGAVHGRGSLDMKGGLVAALHALRAIRLSGVELAGEAVLQSVISEEDGGLGTFDAIRRIGHADGALIPEPSRLELILAQAGALTFDGTVRGHSAHAAFRLEGDSAIDRYVGIHHRLHELERARNADVDHPLMRPLPLPYPISVGRLEAGVWSSSVPDLLRFEGRVGVRVGEPPEEVRRIVERLVEGDAELVWTGGQFASADTPVDHPLADLVRSCAAEVLGVAPASRGVPYGADMRLFTERGIPCVMLGPGDPRGAHTVDEHVPVDDLVKAARIMTLVVLRFLGTN